MLPKEKRRGAIEPFVYGLSKAMSNEIKVDVLSRGNGCEKSGNMSIKTFEYSPVLLNSFGRLVGYPHTEDVLFNINLIKNLYRLNKQAPFDLIHVHNVYALPAALTTKFTLGLPVIYNVHNLLRNVTPLKYCDKVIANSEFTRNILVKKQGLKSSNVSVLPIAIDPDFHKPTYQKNTAKKLLGLEKFRILLFVGRKMPEKGPRVLIEALPLILKRNPDVIAVFIGPDFSFSSSSLTYTNQLIAIAASLSVHNRVIMKKFVSTDELKQYYAAADIFVFPSIWQEPFGTVLLEALSYQKPVIASDVGAVQEIILDKKNGLVIPPNRPQELADSINYLLDNEELGDLLGKNGRETVREKFSFEVIGRRCIEIYQEVIGIAR